MVLSDAELESLWTLAESVRVPQFRDTVYKDECMFSLQSGFEGLYVNLRTWRAFSREFLPRDLQAQQGSGAYLFIQLEEVEEKDEAEEVTKLAIGVEGGFGGKQKIGEKIAQVVVFSVPFFENVIFQLDDPDLPDPIAEAARAVLAHKGAHEQQQLVAWESVDERPVSKYSEDLLQENPRNISTNPSDWVCEQTGFKDGNLWLNLSDGFIGSGRKNFDGTGGTNGAVDHYSARLAEGKNYPLVVKLGTITSQGTADVYSYAHDEDCMVTDPFLKSHLEFFGIDPDSLQKTEKTISEMELEMNKDFAFEKILESGDALEPVTGPGLVGLTNMGNTCYLNSVVELLAGVEEIGKKFSPNLVISLGDRILASGGDGPSRTVFEFSKLVQAIAGGIPRITPALFRSEFTKSHPEFASSRQQDAQEFFLHLMKELGRAEHALGMGSTETDLFSFAVEDKLDLGDGNVSYSTGRREIIFPLSVKRENLSNPAKQAKETVSFETCLSHTMAPTVIEGFRHPVTGAIAATATKSFAIATMPRYILLAVGRYFFDEAFAPQKMDCAVEMPEKIDLERIRAKGIQPGETQLPESTVPPPQFTPNPELIAQITAMGFSRGQAANACKMVNNASAETAIQLILAGDVSDEVNEDRDNESIALLTSMGFSEQQAVTALGHCGNNVERAADWLFNHPEELVQETAADTSVAAPSPQKTLSDGRGLYSLVGMVSHIGRNTAVGHYVCHLKKKNGGDWLLFNDAHVAKSVHPPLDYGYLYLYQRD